MNKKGQSIHAVVGITVGIIVVLTYVIPMSTMCTSFTYINYNSNYLLLYALDYIVLLLFCMYLIYKGVD